MGSLAPTRATRLPRTEYPSMAEAVRDLATILSDWIQNSSSRVLAAKLRAPTSLTLAAGTSAGTVADVQTLLDGNVYSVAEAAGTPGFDLQLGFTELTHVHGLLLRAYYAGSATHYCEVGIWNNATSAYDVLLTLETGNQHSIRYLELPHNPNYLAAGVATVRLYHPVAGNASHDLHVDYVAILE